MSIQFISTTGTNCLRSGQAGQRGVLNGHVDSNGGDEVRKKAPPMARLIFSVVAVAVAVNVVNRIHRGRSERRHGGEEGAAPVARRHPTTWNDPPDGPGRSSWSVGV